MTFGWWAGFGAWCYVLARSGMYGTHTIRLVDTVYVKHTDIAVDDLGFVVYKEAHEMRLNNNDDFRLAFIVGAQTAVNEARAEVSEAQKLLELAQSEQQ